MRIWGDGNMNSTRHGQLITPFHLRNQAIKIGTARAAGYLVDRMSRGGSSVAEDARRFKDESIYFCLILAVLDDSYFNERVGKRG